MGKEPTSAEEIMTAILRDVHNRKFLLLSYNAIKGFKSSSYCNGQLIVCANDIGRGFLTREDGTFDQKLDVQYDELTEAVEKEIGKNIKEATIEEVATALTALTEKNPQRFSPGNSQQRAIENGRAERIVQLVKNRAHNVIQNANCIIIYAGLHALIPAINLAKDAHAHNPNARIVVASCWCDWEEKWRLLRNTDITLLDCECGGGTTMGAIAESLRIILQKT